MSITIIQQPSTVLASANNDNFYTVSGSNYSAPNIQDYQYTADVYINGVKQTTLTAFPDPTFNYGIFNLKDIVNNFVNYDFSYNLSDDAVNVFHTASNSSATVQLKFGENYTNANGLFTQNLNVTLSNTVTYLNSSLTYVDQNTFDMDLLLTNFMTFYSDPNYFAYTESRQFLYYYNTGVVASASIGTYNSNGALVGSYTISNPFSSSVGVQYIGCGLPQLSQLPGTSYTVLSGPSTIINSQVSVYTLAFAGVTSSQFLIDSNGDFFTDSNGSDIYTFFGGSNISNAAVFNIKTNQGRNQPYSYTLYWLNELGGMESWLFNGKNISTISKQTSQYQKSPGKITANGVTRNIYDRATTDYFTVITNRIELNSNWLTDNQVIFLKSLFSSPVIYVQDESGILQAANISEGQPEYPLSKAVYKKGYSLKLNLDISNQDYRQSL